jgi:hypothetical protein
MKKKSTSQFAPARRSLSTRRSLVRRPVGEGGFFNLRVLIGLFIVLAGVFLALAGSGAFSSVFAQGKGTKNNSSNTSQASPGTQTPDVVQMVGPVRLDQDLRRLPYVAPKPEFEERRLTRYHGRDRCADRIRNLRSGVRPETAQKPLATGAHHARATVDI